ncbi:hypothetical protein GCM10009573_30540 [Agromyces bracchium]
MPYGSVGASGCATGGAGGAGGRGGGVWALMAGLLRFGCGEVGPAAMLSPERPRIEASVAASGNALVDRRQDFRDRTEATEPAPRYAGSGTSTMP